jgi:hypothetical protein
MPAHTHRETAARQKSWPLLAGRGFVPRAIAHYEQQCSRRHGVVADKLE